MRGARLAPRRYEMEPAHIAALLAETLIIERLANGDCRIRVAGTGVCDNLGVNLRGQSFFALWSHEDQVVLRDNINTISEYGSAGFYTLTGTLTSDDPAAHFELLLLPLTHLEDRIDRMLGCLVLDNAPEWLKEAPPAALTLRSNELIWPEGRPRVYAKIKARLPDPPLFQRLDAPVFGKRNDIRRARLVRDARRSFLVYDGGRAQEPVQKSAEDEPRR